MGRGFTSQMARNIFYGGTLFFVLLFAVLIFDTEQRIPARSNSAELTPAVVRGKHLWETRNCIGCHTLLGEGAYFAPELGNVYAAPRARLHQGLDQGAAHARAGAAPDAAVQLHRAATRRPDRVPEVDQWHQH
jgi:mono/diheme cytochrome c family protein